MRKTVTLSIIAALALCIIFGSPARIYASSKPNLSAKTACIYCVDDDTFIYKKSINKKICQASTTKLMTAVLLMESGKINSNVKVSANAAYSYGGNRMIKTGDIYTAKDLLYAMMLASDSDSTVAIAEMVGGYEKRFVTKMNAKARKLGMTNTHYVNVHGWDARNHYSTAADTARITAYAYKYSQIRKTWSVKNKTIRSLKYKNSWALNSTDLIIGYTKSFKGGKTGTTNAAGFCFTGVYEYKGKTYVTVVFGCPTETDRWKDTKALHSYIKQTWKKWNRGTAKNRSLICMAL